MATQIETSRSFTGPANPRRHLSRQIPSTSRSQKKPWQSRRSPSFRSSKSQTREDPETQRLSREISRQTTASQRRKPKWWKVRLFRGMIDDVKRRLPFYWSDWRDAWDYRVIPATVYMYFAKYDHTKAFSLRRNHFACSYNPSPPLCYHYDLAFHKLSFASCCTKNRTNNASPALFLYSPLRWTRQSLKKILVCKEVVSLTSSAVFFRLLHSR